MAIIRQTTADLAPARRFPVKNIPAEKLARGIVVRSPNWLGDAVMTLPAVKALRTILPEGAPLVVLAPPQTASLFRIISEVDYVIVIKQPHTKWSDSVFRKLRKYNFTVGVLFNNSLRDAWQMRRAGISDLYGRAARCRSLLMKRAFSFPKWRKGVLNESHHCNEYLSMAAAMGAKIDKTEMPEFHSQLQMGHLPLKIQGFCQHPQLLVMAPGAAYGAAKRWSSEKFRQVADYCIKKGFIVAILGSTGEHIIGEEVIEGLPANRAFNLAGETDFVSLYNLIRNARACVANDSGIMHLAAAMGVPGVAVFGPTDYRATGPITDKWLLVFDKEPCAPCFQRVCPDGKCKGIEKITSIEVIEALHELKIF